MNIAGIRFNPAAFTAAPFTINTHFTDLDEDHVLGVGRSAVHHRPNTVDAEASASLRIDRTTFFAALSDLGALDDAQVSGDVESVTAFFASMTKFGTAPLIEPLAR